LACFTFFKNTKIIEIDSPATTATIQETYNAVRTFEDDVNNLDFQKMMDGSGKDCLGFAETAITLRLVNCWRLKAADRCGPCCVSVTISGGNLIATNAFGDNPLAPATFVTYTIAQAVSAATSTDIMCDMTKVKRYLTNKKSISGTTLSVFCDSGMCTTEQTYTLDDSCDPKSQTPV